MALLNYINVDIDLSSTKKFLVMANRILVRRFDITYSTPNQIIMTQIVLKKFSNRYCTKQIDPYVLNIHAQCCSID